MVSGDNKTVAEAVAKEVGIERVFSEVLPENKAEYVKQLQAEGKFVAMVGDGVNDAPALAQADVGMALGTGTDVAIKVGDVVLMRGDLNGVADAIELSRATMRNIRQNLGFAFGYNTLGIPLAAGVLFPFTGWLLSPMIASLAMALSSVSVVTNALRLRGFTSTSARKVSPQNGRPAVAEQPEARPVGRGIEGRKRGAADPLWPRPFSTTTTLPASEQAVCDRKDTNMVQSFQAHAPAISCEGCANAIKRSLGALPGVQAVQVDVPGKNVTVQHDTSLVSDTDLKARLEKAGFPIG